MIILIIVRLPYRTISSFHIPEKNHPTLIHKLNLTDEQIEKERIIRNDTRQKIKPLIEKIRAKHEEIRKLTKSESIDSPRIASRQKEIHDLSQKVREIHKRHLENFKKILTNNQKEKFHKIVESSKNNSQNTMSGIPNP
jgi:Spy/CpxP family protein refolding chaperone